MYPRSRWLAALVAVALVAGLALAARPLARAAGLVIRAAQLGGVLESSARRLAQRVDVLPPAAIPTRYGQIPAQVYQPVGRARRTALLIPGVHSLGMQEPRLRALANELAASGIRVVTFGLPDLMVYTITPRSTDVIEDAIAWSAAQTEWAADGRVGIIGISFAGGLSVVAAGRDAIRDKVAFVVSFGGHADLPRVMRYLATGESPAASGIQAVPPHDFGVAVLLYGLSDSGIVPPEQAPGLRGALATYLAASQLTLVDTNRAEEEFSRARNMATGLPEPSATYMKQVNARDVRRLGASIEPFLDKLGTESPAVSPARAVSLPAAPIYLLHGAEDSIIPTAETVLLGDDLRSRGVQVRVLVSELITHAEVNDAAAAGAAWRLVTFWADVLRR